MVSAVLVLDSFHAHAAAVTAAPECNRDVALEVLLTRLVRRRWRALCHRLVREFSPASLPEALPATLPDDTLQVRDTEEASEWYRRCYCKITLPHCIAKIRAPYQEVFGEDVRIIFGPFVTFDFETKNYSS